MQENKIWVKQNVKYNKINEIIRNRIIICGIIGMSLYDWSTSMIDKLFVVRDTFITHQSTGFVLDNHLYQSWWYT